jgi:2-polyprenyl-6-methoxyphenol hydroxylase-like FAD-dependent oxidoreductase
MRDDDVLVLIAGGSLVGLSTAVFLGIHGVPSLVVERHPGTAVHPRAAHFNQRTIELYRAAGLEPAIEEAAAAEFVQNGAIMAVETLAGKELEWYFRSVNEGFESLSPTRRLFITQRGLEPILRARAEALGARLEYGAEVVSHEQDDDGVTVVVRQRDGGDERAVRARYVVAADGSRSPIRERLGIPLQGHPPFAHCLTIYFRADVRPLLRDRVLSVVYVFNDDVQGFFRFEFDGDAGFLAVNAARDAGGERTSNVAADQSEARCVQLVRAGLGVRDLPVEIESVQPWVASAEWAERFSDGRVFLAGDAAHAMPPTGGFGGNTGVHDAHNLAWKLASVLAGTAGPELLASYDAERRPVGEFTAEQAYTRWVVRLAPELGKENLVPFVPDAPIELGYRYRSPAILAEAGDDGAAYENPHEPSGAPGTRAPHVALELDGKPISSLDLAGPGFALLAGPGGEGWCTEAVAAAAELGVGLDAHRIGGPDIADPDGRFAETFGTGDAGATLVRPDGFVAWRTDAAADGAGGAVAAALAAALGRAPSGARAGASA